MILVTPMRLDGRECTMLSVEQWPIELFDAETGAPITSEMHRDAALDILEQAMRRRHARRDR